MKWKPLFRVSGWVWVRWTPKPLVVTISDNEDYNRVLLLYSYYATITVFGILLSYTGVGL